jgi:hypothetical protein
MPRIFFLVLELNYSEVLNKNAFTFIKMQCGAKRKIEREFFQIFVRESLYSFPRINDLFNSGDRKNNGSTLFSLKIFKNVK